MAKHHVICKSKTLDVPIIITSSIGEMNTNGDGGGGGGGGGYFNDGTMTFESTNSGAGSGAANNQNGGQNNMTMITNSKLNKGYSLDSKYLTSQNSLSSSSTNNDITSSSSNSISSCSTNSHHMSRQFLLPPPSIDLLQTSNINADFETSKMPIFHTSK